MKFDHVKDVFFDLDHTLWDFDRNSELTFHKIFEINKIDLNLDEFLEIYVPLNLQYWKLYRENEIDKPTLRFRRLYDAFTMMGMAVKTSTIHRLSDDYIKFLTTFNHLFDGAFDLLDYLKPKYNLHIITNGFKEVQHGKLNNANIEHYFQTVTNSEMVGVKKPNPKIFNHALAQAKAKPEHSVMIGDNLEADVLGAINVGIDAICFNYHNEDLDGNILEVKALLELKNYL